MICDRLGPQIRRQAVDTTSAFGLGSAFDWASPEQPRGNVALRFGRVSGRSIKRGPRRPWNVASSSPNAERPGRLCNGMMSLRKAGLRRQRSLLAHFHVPLILRCTTRLRLTQTTFTRFESNTDSLGCVVEDEMHSAVCDSA